MLIIDTVGKRIYGRTSKRELKRVGMFAACTQSQELEIKERRCENVR
jgi:hypothetical protein